MTQRSEIADEIALEEEALRGVAAVEKALASFSPEARNRTLAKLVLQSRVLVRGRAPAHPDFKLPTATLPVAAPSLQPHPEADAAYPLAPYKARILAFLM